MAKNRKRRKKRAQKVNREAPAKDPAATSDAREEQPPEEAVTTSSAQVCATGGAGAAGDPHAADAVGTVESGSKAGPLASSEEDASAALAASESSSEEGDPVAERLQAVEAQRDEYLDLARRARAELENYRKRVERDRASHRTLAQVEVLREFLKPLDDLDRAMADAEARQDFDTLFEGLGLVRTDLWKALSDIGLSRIEAGSGTRFDPNVHEALVQVPHPEIPAGVVVEETTPGYCLGERVLRAAKVVVSSGSSAFEDATSEGAS